MSDQDVRTDENVTDEQQPTVDVPEAVSSQEPSGLVEVSVPQDGALVGDEAIREAAIGTQVDRVVESAPAQVAAERRPDADRVQVYETSVKTDHVITDPSSPLAVQIPDAGRGSTDLPIHRLTEPSPEEVFADAPADEDDES